MISSKRTLLSHPYRNWLLLIVIACVAGVVLLIIATMNPAVTRYVESPRFRVELEEETAKGLHFPKATFAPITRSGSFTAESENFSADNGRKAITRLDAHGITGRFNPLGVFLRRWQIDDLHIDRAKIGIHTYEPAPEPSPSKPWYHIFLPGRVYLKRTWSDHVDVTWPMRNETGGIFETRLVITPHGRDFEYRANGGTLRNPSTPALPVQQIHLLITKKIVSLYDLDVTCGEGTIHAGGTAVITGEKSTNFSFKWTNVPVREWLPQDWGDNIRGAATGNLHWTGNNYTLAAATMTGAADVKEGRVANLKFLDAIATISNHHDLAALDLDECRSNFRWRESSCELEEIAIEQRGKFRIEGTVSFGPNALGGTIQLGVAPEYLDWLPNSGEIFSTRRAGYVWTAVHLSGTLSDPKQDLSPRLLAALKESPGALITAALRALSTWLKKE